MARVSPQNRRAYEIAYARLTSEPLLAKWPWERGEPARLIEEIFRQLRDEFPGLPDYELRARVVNGVTRATRRARWDVRKMRDAV